jgi:hypothetical protein
MARLEELDLGDEPVNEDVTNYLEMTTAVDKSLGLDEDDDPVFARICGVLRTWDCDGH